MLEKITQASNRCYEFVMRNTEQWHLDNPHTWLEVTNHVLRVFIQTGETARFKKHFTDLAELQKEDGGWGEYNDSPKSAVRVSAFATQMLLRANMELQDAGFGAAVEKGLQFLLNTQQPNGSWKDQRWHLFDATSVPTGTLLFAVNNNYGSPQVESALKKSMGFIESLQADSGLWEIPQKKVATVESTAHLLQKCITNKSSTDIIFPAVTALLKVQDANGAWAGGNMDATCDVVRCLLYFNAAYPDNVFCSQVEQAAAVGTGWLAGNVKEGLGNRPSSKPNVLISCDFIDTASKYIIYEKQQSKMRSLYS